MAMFLSCINMYNRIKPVPTLVGIGKGMRDFTGQKFGRLTVLHRVPGGAWACQCECGNPSYVTTGNLRKGNSRSCGCLWREKITTHGLIDTPEYRVWKAMRSRCNSKGDLAWRNYGARGISVCPEWDDFLVFFQDMGKRPSPLYDLDRIDNDKGYSKENCRWVTRQQNLNNRRTNHYVEWAGEKKTVAEWAQKLGINYRTLNNRLNRGWSPARALSKDIH